MGYVNYASAARTSVVVTAVIALLGCACFGTDSICGPEPDLPSGGPCSAAFSHCVDQVLTALLTSTPTNPGFLGNTSYPSTHHGAVTGAASCAPESANGVCQTCLSTAKTSLDVCKSTSSGSYTNDGCTMWFGQIVEPDE